MVYRHYNQQQLNDQYNNRLHVPDYAEYLERWEKSSRQSDEKYEVIKDIYYGNDTRECLDIFPSAKPHSKTLIFIHGGYWHLFDKTMFHFIAPTYLKRDVTTVFLNYPLAPAASLSEIVLSCRLAIRWLHRNILRFNGDPSRMYVMGHSAGGHLTCMLTIEREMNFLGGVISLSGLFRLEPLMLSNLNSILGMDKEMAMQNSPVLLDPKIFSPLLLAVGTDETDEFKNQSLDMYGSWKNKHRQLALLNVNDRNHYSIMDAVIEENSELQSEIFRIMKI